MIFLQLLKGILIASAFFQVIYAAVNTASLLPLLSSGAVIDTDAPRWSDYKAPLPGAVVHPASEADVQITVKWAIDRNIKFFTQNGGNGWATTFSMSSNDIGINLDRLRSINFNADKTQAIVAGGALTGDVIPAASANSALIVTASCNCVGYLGAALGGGIGVLQGEFGLGADELLSLNFVNAFGDAITVKPSSNDLWYALRGAAPNFGIVTSVVVRSHPVIASDLLAWTGSLIFRPDQLEAVITAAGKLHFRPPMALTLTFVNQAATNSQIIIASPFYHGSTAQGRAAFQSLLDIGPISDATTMTPYTSWNNGSNNACVKGGLRPTWGVGLERMDPKIWRQVYNSWLELVRQPGFERSSILLNAYALDKVRSVPDDSSAIPWRHTIKFHASITVFYTDPLLEQKALFYGNTVRALWRLSNKQFTGKVYINNGFGDESNVDIYGASLPRLTTLKKKYDPKKRFNQWFPI
ncbi:hypothetical protein HBI56_091390 [Parastagonospora nodorum]|nr:hypothetical protein HBH52_102420 [Parastagonospora nodorum]KAH4211614.1 hypothetical protein HBI95_042830 [Parastagonospora nodorum]KAH4800587.1 hypothetical protein HBH61_210390 [Parastagonospora nodorum]KAH4928379.1 hypothetical protein HBI79_128400 [Parastagonospora nodorum]KAH5359998.1 hypothetical protein HBI48_107330 [Parastagonospora nodorum]